MVLQDFEAKSWLSMKPNSDQFHMRYRRGHMYSFHLRYAHLHIHPPPPSFHGIAQVAASMKCNSLPGDLNVTLHPIAESSSPVPKSCIFCLILHCVDKLQTSNMRDSRNALVKHFGQYRTSGVIIWWIDSRGEDNCEESNSNILIYEERPRLLFSMIVL